MPIIVVSTYYLPSLTISTMPETKVSIFQEAVDYYK